MELFRNTQDNEFCQCSVWPQESSVYTPFVDPPWLANIRHVLVPCRNLSKKFRSIIIHFIIHHFYFVMEKSSGELQRRNSNGLDFLPSENTPEIQPSVRYFARIIRLPVIWGSFMLVCCSRRTLTACGDTGLGDGCYALADCERHTS